MGRPTQHNSARRRGAMYVAVLMIAMVVALMGISGLFVAQRNLQAGVDTADMVATRFLAESAIELAMQEVADAPGWRALYVDQGWTADQRLGRGDCAWKIETSSEAKAAGLYDVYRIYGRGDQGQAARAFSLLACVYDPGDGNLLGNSGFESGLVMWTQQGDCKLEWRSDSPYAGGYFLRVADRGQSWASAYQDFTDEIEAGKTYDIYAWVRSPEGAQQVKVTIELKTTYGTYWRGLGYEQVTDSWKRCGGSTSLSWGGTLIYARYFVETPGTTLDLDLDDLKIGDGSADLPEHLIPLAGTWRRESAAR